jgi:GT2 family glycosyltransferase
VITIVIPTVQPERAEDTAALAVLTAGCDCETVIVHDKKRQGFSKTVNRGWKQATGDTMILNDDILWFQYGWLDTLSRALHSDPSWGIVGPSGRSSTKPMCYGWAGQSGFEIVDHLPFWCVLVKQALVEQIGYLDEAFIHYGSDNHYCQMARRAGCESVWVRDVFLKHEHHGSGLITEWKEHDDAVWSAKHKLRH